MHAIQNIWNGYYKDILTLCSKTCTTLLQPWLRTFRQVCGMRFVVFLTVVSYICDRTRETGNTFSYLLVEGGQ